MTQQNPSVFLKEIFVTRDLVILTAKKKRINLESRKLVKLSLIQKDYQVSDVDFGMLLTYHIKTSENTEIS